MKRKSTQLFSQLFVWLGVLLPLLTACERELLTPEPTPTPTPTEPVTLTTLRASGGQTLGTAGLYLSVWGKEQQEEILLTKVPKVGDGWKLQEPCVVRQPAFITATYPDTLLRHKESLLIDDRDQTPVYFASQELGNEDSRSLTLNFKLVQAKINLHFDLSAFPSSSRVEELQVAPRYAYGWLNMKEGVFLRFNSPEYDRGFMKFPIGKTISELCPDGNPYRFQYLMIPQGECDLAVIIKIAGEEHYFNVRLEEVKSNTEYNVTTSLFNRKEIIPVSEADQRKGMDIPIPPIENIFFTDYEYTCTHQYMQDLSNNSGTYFRLWVDNRTDRQEQLDYRLLIRDESGQLVSASPIYSGLSVRPYHYDGFVIPFYLSVPRPGRYQHQLLLRGENGVWYEPNQKDDDTPEDKYFNVHPQQPLFVASVALDDPAGHTHMATIQSPKYNTPGTTYWRLNNYSDKEQHVTIKLYNRREPFENHHQMILDDTTTWCDPIGAGDYTIPPHTSHLIAIPYNLSKRRPEVNRYLSYICASVTYHTPNPNGLEQGKEYPLLQDGNIIYRKAHTEKNPFPFVGSSLVHNLILIQPI